MFLERIVGQVDSYLMFKLVFDSVGFSVDGNCNAVVS